MYELYIFMHIMDKVILWDYLVVGTISDYLYG